ncbi:MAG: exodeoxyribonuclease VII large subunit [Bacillota bacterium]
MQKPQTILQVTEINRYVKGLIHGDPRLSDLWVTGEISNFKHHRSGHMYFTIKDSFSSLRCVFFRRENARCPFDPSDGMEVIVHGNLSVYEPAGAYQLYVSEMEPAGMGSLYVAFEQLKKKLAAEGLFDARHKKELPLVPCKIALVTSPSGAALQDILLTIKKRFFNVHLVIVESLVQGAGAAEDIVRSLDLLNERDDIDLIILTRGGGSLEDLWPFNEEKVARAIYKSEIPIISAVGHETDFTIADFAADYRAHTPTEAAAAAVPVAEELLSGIIKLQDRAALALKNRVQQEKQRLDHIVSERFFRRPAERIKNSREQLNRLEKDLKRETVRLLQVKGMKLNALVDRLESYSPLKVMSRGYSFCRDEGGNIIRSVKDIKVGQLLQLTFRDGRADCRAEKIEEDLSVDKQEN